MSERARLVVLFAAAPIWHPPTVPSLIHELKLWKSHADFSVTMVGHHVTGEAIVKALLSDEECRLRSSPNGSDYLLDSPYGIRVVELGTEDASENRGEGHIGQLLKALAEGQAPSTSRVVTSSGRAGTVADVFQDAVMRFSAGRELEFLACSIAYWLPEEETTWTNEFGDLYSFDQLMSLLLAMPYGKGVCAGTHLPYSVAVLLARDAHAPILSRQVRDDATRWLKRLSALLERRQLDEGAWNGRWAGADSATLWNDTLMDRIAATGHHLEWMAIAPMDTLPSVDSIRRAVVALESDVRASLRIPHRSFKVILPLSHAARALCLLSGVDAFTCFSNAWKSGRLKDEAVGAGNLSQGEPATLNFAIEEGTAPLP